MKCFQEWICKLMHFLSWATSPVPNYIVVCMALDRVLAIRLPFWYREHTSNSLSIARKLTWIFIVLSSVITSPALYLFTTDTKHEICDIRDSVNSFHVTVVFFIYFQAIPFAILLVTNAIFVHALMRKRPLAGKGRQSEAAKQRQQNDRNYLVMIVLITFSYLLLSLVMVCCAYTANHLAINDEPKEQIDFFLTVLTVPVILNNSWNFFIYFASGKLFRKSFKKIDVFWKIQEN